MPVCLFCKKNQTYLLIVLDFYNFYSKKQIDGIDTNTDDPQNFLDAFKREILKNQDDPITPFTSTSKHTIYTEFKETILAATNYK